MKTDKPQKEAVLRAQQSLEINKQQEQEALLRPLTATTSTEDAAAALNESHQNKLETYHNLRKMDHELAKKSKKGAS